MYGIQDVCTLNIIRALRELKIPTRAIRAYLERRSVGETLSLLDREEALLRRRMAELEAALEEARARRARLEQYRAAEDGRVFFRREEARPYVFLEEDIILEKEIDFLLKKLEHRHQDYLKIIGSQCMGAAVDEEWLSRGVYNHFSRVFFLTEPGLPHDDALPAGEYAASITVGPMTAWRSTAASCWRGSRRRPPPGGAAPGAVPGGRPRHQPGGGVRHRAANAGGITKLSRRREPSGAGQFHWFKSGSAAPSRRRRPSRWLSPPRHTRRYR